MTATPPPPPALPDELVEEILLRLPPDEPASLLRASLISKDWGRTISSPAFRRRLHEFHRTPPVLGFLHDWDEECIPRFIPTTASSFSLAGPDRQTWEALDYRQGRALFVSKDLRARELLVWEPITGVQRRVPVPWLWLFQALVLKEVELYQGAAVFCAADRCDHRDCQGDPFGLVFVFTANVVDDEDKFVICSYVFSSETGTWGKRTVMQSVFPISFPYTSSVLVGGSLLYFMAGDEVILQYDLATHSMTVLLCPPVLPGYEGRFNIMLTEDGRLGVAEYQNQNLKLWKREASDGTDAHWVLSRVISLVNLLPTRALLNADTYMRVLGVAEGTSTIFLNTVAGLFTVELQSEKARKVYDENNFCNLIPVVSFYTPRRGKHQDPPSLGPTEEAGGEEGGEKDKAIEHPQQIFDTWFSAIEEGDLVNARFSDTLQTRVPSRGEVALKCPSTDYGCALPHKAEAMNDPLHDFFFQM